MQKYYYYNLVDDDDYYFITKTNSDPYNKERVKNYDEMLHEALSEIFRKRRSLSSDQIKELVADQDSIIKLILEKNPALSGIFPSGNKFSILWIALLGYYQNSAELLVRSGADVNEPCDSLPLSIYQVRTKLTVLHLLLLMYPSSWNERFIALVIDHGADLHALVSNGETALHYAVKKSRVGVSELLLEKEAAVNATNSYEFTPMLLALKFSDRAVIKEFVTLLMKHGADVTLRDRDGCNALHYLSRIPDVKQADLIARVLIEKGASLDDRSKDCGMQPIHTATFYGQNELVELFLDHGADVNARDIKGKTPIFYAARCENSTVLLTLLKRGANVDLKETDGTTALHAACPW